MTTKVHRTRVKTELQPNLYPALYQAVCDDCGPVGSWQELCADAQAIADRHQGAERSFETRP